MPRALAKPALTLNVSQAAWALHRDICPCDVDFIEYLRDRGVGGRTVFHFGTGAHHVVGIENARTKRPNQVLGITASRGEYDAYIDHVVADPGIANSYKVLFADIYTLDARILPRFDVVTLFHLCEFYDPAASAYAPLDDRALVDLFRGKLNPGGRLCFYLGSNGRDTMLRLVGSFIAKGKLAIDEVFRPLLICTVPRRRAAAARSRDRALIMSLLDA